MNNAIRNILLIEDDTGDAELIMQMVSNVNGSYRIKISDRLSEGLKILSEEAFDIVLLDLGLPDSSGLETLRIIQRQARDIPIIVMTGLAQEELATEAISLGAQDYLVKGRIDGNVLERSVRYGIERKRSEAQLRRMTRQTELILSTAGEGILGLDTNGTIIFLNNSAVEMLGYSTDEMIGKNCFVMFHHSAPNGMPYSAEKCPIDAAFRSGSDQTGEEVFWRKNGTGFSVDFTSRPLYEENRITGAVVTFRDITDRKRAEEALARSKAEFEAIFNSLSDAAIFVDTYRRVLLINQAFTRQFGYTFEEVKGRTTEFLYLNPADFHEQGRKRYHTREKTEPYPFQIQYRRKDGTQFWAETSGIQVRDEKGNILGYAGISRDISERKRTEDQITHLASFPELNPNPIVETNLEGRVTYANPEIKKRFPDLAKKGSAHPILSGLSGIVAKIRQEGKISLSREVTISGFVYYQMIHYSPEMGFVRVYHADITRLKRAEDQIRTAKELGDALNRINSLIFSTLDFDEIMEKVIKEAAQAAGADLAAIYVPGNGSWIARYTYGQPKLAGRHLNEGEIRYSIVAVKERKTVRMNNLTDNEETCRLMVTEYGVKAILDAPLLAGKEIIGDFALYSCKNGEVFTQAHEDFVNKVASSVSLAVKNARLFSSLRESEEAVKHLAHHDQLTGLPNRRLFQEVAAVELAQAKRNTRKVAIFYMDLDRFKEVNDTFGHETGDELLKEAASRLRSVIRTSDSIARIGGDEFNLLISDIDHAEYASEVARKILRAFRDPFMIYGHELNTSTSIGISIFPDDSDRIEELLKYADVAMYYAKENGRNTFHFYSPTINTRSLERVRFENDLRRAIERDEFRLYFQPIVNIKTKKIVSAEALLRWQHPEKGLLLPERFFEAAQDIGLMPDIEDWVLRNVGKQIRAWHNLKILTPCVTINVSSRQFQSANLVGRVARIIEEGGIGPDCLNIEITETIAMRDVDRSVIRLKELSQMGIGISIDDFGTGYSSLSYLKRLPIDRLKIDKSFVQEICTDRDDRTIVKAVTAMAHNMRMKVVAEGVETKEQLEFLEKTGCDEMQGFLYSKPVPADELMELVTAEK